MNTISSIQKWILKTVIVFALCSIPTQEVKAGGYPVIDSAHIQQSVMNFALDIKRAANDVLNWAATLKEAIESTLLINEILTLTNFIRDIQNEVMTALGTVEDIISIPSNILADIMGFVGSVKDTIMDVAGVGGIWGEIQGIFSTISEVEAFGQNFIDGSLMDFGNFGNALGAYTAVRGVHTRTAIEYLDPNRMRQEQRSIERIIDTFENSDNAAEIAKGNAEMTAAVYKQVAHANQLQAMDVQRRTAESWAREEEARARAARGTSATRFMLGGGSME